MAKAKLSAKMVLDAARLSLLDTYTPGHPLAQYQVEINYLRQLAAAASGQPNSDLSFVTLTHKEFAAIAQHWGKPVKDVDAQKLNALTAPNEG